VRSRLYGSLLQYPARMAFGCYVAAIAVGTLLLSRPFASAGREPIGLLDAAFTATSAVCVTGLVVRSTGADFSFAGQFIILSLIQLGGIGIMTITTFAILELGSGATIRHRAVIAETLGARLADDLHWVLRNVLTVVLLFESIGFALLAIRNGRDMPWPEALWHSLFHSVSAFCNAGFALFDDSLTRYQDDVLVNCTVIFLIVVGGIGAPVAFDLRRNVGRSFAGTWRRLSLHTKLVLVGTALLLIIGTASILLLEWNKALANMGWGQRFMVALFQSASARTAGFNTIDLTDLTNATLFVLIVLMFIGACPCSTGGGFKVTTFMVVLLAVWARFRGRRQTQAFGRAVPDQTIDRALATMLAFAATATVALTVLLVFEEAWWPRSNERGLFLNAMFETASAIGTVGYSMGLTGTLSPLSKLLIIVLMLAGRLGPISIFIALAKAETRQAISYAHEDVLIG